MTESMWISLGFIIFIGLVFKPIKRVMIYALDKRAEDIDHKLNEAKKLKEEAEAMLRDCKQNQQNTMEEVQHILSQAEKEATRIIREGKKELEETCEKHTKLAMQRLSGYESTALSEVHSTAVDIAIYTVRSLLRDRISQGTLTEEELSKLFADVNKQLN